MGNVAGFDETRLDRLTAWLDNQVSTARVAGASVLVARHGEEAFFASAGDAELAADPAGPRAFARDTVVRLFSMTKPVTTVAAMMLYEEGAFQLDDPIAKYLPGFDNARVWSGGEIDNTIAAETPITVRHVMTHTSGLTYGFMRVNVVDRAYRRAEADPTSNTTLEQWIDQLAELPLICQPGSQWNYSVSTDVLGRLVEVWSGKTLEAFFQERIFTPLSMQDTGFHVREANAGRFAGLYVPPTGGELGGMTQKSAMLEDKPTGITLQESAEGSRYLAPAKLFSGGGGLVGTIDDYARFCQMLLNGGQMDGHVLLSRKTVKYMMTNQLPGGADMAAMGQPVWSETNYDGIGFGLGGAVVIDPVKAAIVASAGEYHWGGAASTFFWLDPLEDLFVVFLTQLMPSSTYPIRRELRVRVYQALVGD